jgi:hypothetical protein
LWKYFSRPVKKQPKRKRQEKLHGPVAANSLLSPIAKLALRPRRPDGQTARPMLPAIKAQIS